MSQDDRNKNDSHPSHSQRLRFERDLYRNILDLNSTESLEPFLERGLDLVMDITGSRKGLLGLGRSNDGDSMPTEWWVSRGGNDDEGFKRRVSSAIVRRALVEGRLVETPSAFLDPRFEGQESVRREQIESVLCVPIGDRLGVVYLEGHRRSGPFPKGDAENVELFAREVERIAVRLLANRDRTKSDPTQPYRERMALEGVIGSSPALAELLDFVEYCGRSAASVLLTGASGTGKTAFARLIHEHSPRAGKPFVPINCAAVPEGLIESELFGSEEGAFTTAKARLGHIASAEKGTLFLDEIAELSLGAQAKLLQFLNDKVYFKLGSTEQQLADVRIIGATNVDLDAAVREGRFRQDLFFRLEVLRHRIPALSERRSDIPLLLQYFCQLKARENNLPVPSLSPSALAAAEVADWPGNVRQLASVAERAVVRAAQLGRKELDSKFLFEPGSSITQPKEEDEDAYPESLSEATRQFQRGHILRILKLTKGNMTKASKRLEIARSYLYQLKNSLSLDDPIE